jgi:DNA-binding IclR family transcriptional regulator
VSVDGTKLQELTELTPAEINDAVEALEERGLVKTDKAIGTYPFTFYLAEITAGEDMSMQDNANSKNHQKDLL